MQEAIADIGRVLQSRDTIDRLNKGDQIVARYAEVLYKTAAALNTLRTEYESFRRAMITQAHEGVVRENFAERRGLAALSVLSKGASANGKKT